MVDGIYIDIINYFLTKTNILSFISIQNLCKRYGEKVALNNLNLEIPKGSIFGLLGPNGAGKSTFIRILNQIIASDSGQILLNGKPLSQEHYRDIGYLPEERGLYRKMKVEEQMIYLARLKGLKKSVAKDRVRHYLNKLDLLDRANSNLEDLSKGMQQKIQFISTIIHEPNLIILDEPFSGFDPINADIIKEEIFELQRNGATIIFSSHRMESVEELCEYVALIHNSKKILDGKKIEIQEEFSKGVFSLEYKGEWLNKKSEFDIISESKTSDKTSLEIRLNESQQTNDLISATLSEVELLSFNKKLCSMHEIFVNKIKEEGHE